MDLPLMNKDTHFFESKHQSNNHSLEERIDSLLQSIEMRLSCIRLEKLTALDGDRCVVDLKISSEKDNVHFPEFDKQRISILCDGFNESTFLHELMNALIKCSDRFVEENFLFDGFARFSQTVCPQKIADFSYQTRKIEFKDPRFNGHFREMSYDVDASKAPFYGSGKLGEQQRNTIEKAKVTGGHFPTDRVSDRNDGVECRIIKTN